MTQTQKLEGPLAGSTVVTSKGFEFSGVDFQKIGISALVALAGVAIVVLQSVAVGNIHLMIGSMDVSALATMLEAGVISTAVNALRKFVTVHSDVVPPTQ